MVGGPSDPPSLVVYARARPEVNLPPAVEELGRKVVAVVESGAERDDQVDIVRAVGADAHAFARTPGGVGPDHHRAVIENGPLALDP